MINLVNLVLKFLAFLLEFGLSTKGLLFFIIDGEVGLRDPLLDLIFEAGSCLVQHVRFDPIIDRLEIQL